MKKTLIFCGVLSIPVFVMNILFCFISFDMWLGSGGYVKFISGYFDNRLMAIWSLVSLVGLCTIITFILLMMRYSESIDNLEQARADWFKARQDCDKMKKLYEENAMRAVNYMKKES